MSKVTETRGHTVIRTTENVGPLKLFDSAKRTDIVDKDTGNRGTGYGRTRSEADQRAKDSLWSTNQK
jgi:hypothetical protein